MAPFSKGALDSEELDLGALARSDKRTSDECACSAEQGSRHDVYVVPTRLIAVVSFVCLHPQRKLRAGRHPVGGAVLPHVEILSTADIDCHSSQINCPPSLATHPMPRVPPGSQRASTRM